MLLTEMLNEIEPKLRINDQPTVDGIGGVVTLPRIYLFEICSTTKRRLRFDLTAKILHRSRPTSFVETVTDLLLAAGVDR